MHHNLLRKSNQTIICEEFVLTLLLIVRCVSLVALSASASAFQINQCRSFNAVNCQFALKFPLAAGVLGMLFGGRFKRKSFKFLHTNMHAMKCVIIVGAGDMVKLPRLLSNLPLLHRRMSISQFLIIILSSVQASISVQSVQNDHFICALRSWSHENFDHSLLSMMCRSELRP